MDESPKSLSDGTPMSDDVAVPGMDAVERLVQATSSCRFEEADAAWRDLIAFAEQHAATPFSLAYELDAKANQCESVLDWEGARAAYRQILELPDSNPFDKHRAQIGLCGLFRLQNCFRDALVHAIAALDGARAADSAMLFSDAAIAAASCYTHEKRWSDARAIIDQALARFDSDAIFNGRKAHLLTMRANCALGEQDLRLAEQELADANVTLGPMMDCTDPPPGIQADLICWWATMARLRSEAGDADGAVTAWSEVIARSRQMCARGDDVYSRNSLADALEQFADALEEFGRCGNAYEARMESQTIRQEMGLAEF